MSTRRDLIPPSYRERFDPCLIPGEANPALYREEQSLPYIERSSPVYTGELQLPSL